jgi:agmatinase
MALLFGGSDNKLGSFKKAKVVIVPVPYGETVSYKKGTENAPAAILDASDNMELFDEELNKEIHRIGINTAPFLEVGGLKPEEMVKTVEDKVAGIFRKKKLPVLIGGEHSVTLGAVRAAKKRYNDLSILYFDAHYDLRNRHDGSRYNHACVARRLQEITSVVEVGTRSLSKEEKDFLPHKNITIINMSDLLRQEDWVNTVKCYLSKNIYITIDLDVFDPSIMPSVGNPEPGGIFWHQFLKAMRDIIANKKVVGFDVVELSPIKDTIGPDFMTARLIYKMLGYIFFPKKT